jgi:hypothetical protein
VNLGDIDSLGGMGWEHVLGAGYVRDMENNFLGAAAFQLAVGSANLSFIRNGWTRQSRLDRLTGNGCADSMLVGSKAWGFFAELRRENVEIGGKSASFEANLGTYKNILPTCYRHFCFSQVVLNKQVKSSIKVY